jgi:hypothetical protein
VQDEVLDIVESYLDDTEKMAAKAVLHTFARDQTVAASRIRTVISQALSDSTLHRLCPTFSATQQILPCVHSPFSSSSLFSGGVSSCILSALYIDAVVTRLPTFPTTQRMALVDRFRLFVTRSPQHLLLLLRSLFLRRLLACYDPVAASFPLNTTHQQYDTF